jgi:hypothetical protein
MSSPSPANNRRKKRGVSAKRTTARGSVRGSHGSRSRGRCRSVANDGVTPIGRGGSRVAGLAPIRTAVSRGCARARALVRVPGSRPGEGRRGISMKGILGRGSRAEPSREARWKRSRFANADVKSRCSRDDGISEEPLFETARPANNRRARGRAHRSGSLVVNGDSLRLQSRMAMRDAGVRL